MSFLDLAFPLFIQFLVSRSSFLLALHSFPSHQSFTPSSIPFFPLLPHHSFSFPSFFIQFFVSFLLLTRLPLISFQTIFHSLLHSLLSSPRSCLEVTSLFLHSVSYVIPSFFILYNHSLSIQPSIHSSVVFSDFPPHLFCFLSIPLSIQHFLSIHLSFLPPFVCFLPQSLTRRTTRLIFHLLFLKIKS